MTVADRRSFGAVFEDVCVNALNTVSLHKFQDSWTCRNLGVMQYGRVPAG